MPLLQNQSGEQITGKKLVETLTAPDGTVLYKANHEVAPDNTLKTIDEVWYNEPLKAVNDGLLKGIEPASIMMKDADPMGAAIEAGKLAWDIIKEGKAVGQSSDAMTYVLSKSDTDPLNYIGAKDGASGEYKWEINDACTWFGTINYVTIRVQVEGKYGAVPRDGSPAPKGYYLPSVYVNVAQCSVNFPCSASGSANLANPANIGTSEVNAEVKVYAKLTGGWFLQYIGITVAFEATGSGGFRLIGRV